MRDTGWGCGHPKGSLAGAAGSTGRWGQRGQGRVMVSRSAPVSPVSLSPPASPHSGRVWISPPIRKANGGRAGRSAVPGRAGEWTGRGCGRSPAGSEVSAGMVAAGMGGSGCLAPLEPVPVPALTRPQPGSGSSPGQQRCHRARAVSGRLCPGCHHLDGPEAALPRQMCAVRCSCAGPNTGGSVRSR